LAPVITMVIVLFSVNGRERYKGRYASDSQDRVTPHGLSLNAV